MSLRRRMTEQQSFWFAIFICAAIIALIGIVAYLHAPTALHR
jgi:hypothetical protein